MATQPITCHFDPEALRSRVMAQYGFLTDTDVEALAADPESRLWPCLVRCGAGRFVAPAQDVAHFVTCVEAGGDYVRDVSLRTNWGD